MPEFMMLMKGTDNGAAWDVYIESLSKTGMFRGGSALGNGICTSHNAENLPCSVSGYMRFEADSINKVMALVPGNPVFESGGSIEVLEVVIT